MTDELLRTVRGDAAEVTLHKGVVSHDAPATVTGASG